MVFNQPIWLWGISGIIIPIAIHLLSKKQGRVIYMGSTRHLLEDNTARFKSIQLNEIFLLVLRCLIILLVCFLLADVAFDIPGRKSQWLLVEKGMEQQPDVMTRLNTFQEQGFDVRFLAEGFPSLADSHKVQPLSSYWSIAEQLNKLSLDSAIVFYYGLIRNLKGEKIEKGPFNWIRLEPPVQKSSHYIMLSRDSAWLKKTTASAGGTTHEFKKISRTEVDDKALIKQDPIVIGLFVDKEFTYDAKVLEAALHAIDQQSTSLIKIIRNQNPSDVEKNHFTFWLSQEAPPTHTSTIIGIRPCDETTDKILVQATESRDKCLVPEDFQYLITRRLTAHVVLQGQFVYELAAVLLPHHEQEDLRVINEKEMWRSDFDKKQKPLTANTSASTMIAVLLIVLLMAERYISFRRNQ